MLKRASQADFKGIKACCYGSVLGARITCLAECYGFERKFAEFWVNISDDNISGVVARLGDDITVHSDGKVTDELLFFLMMSGCKSLMSDVDFQLDGYSKEAKQAFVFSGDSEGYCCDSIADGDMRSTYDLISENISGSFSKSEDAYLSFLSDFTFRKLRDRARGKVIHNNGIIACALTSAETDKSALLSGIASDKSARGTGVGKRVVLSITDELSKEGKQVFVIALNDSACGFYRHIGFTEKETIYIMKGNADV